LNKIKLKDAAYINSNTVYYHDPRSEPQRNTGFESIDIVTLAVIL